jgi:exonuclease 3'-5' domain-containing protein 1
VHTLQTAAFNTATADGTTLKSVLESSEIIKVFFDLRNDSDALYHHFGVRLSGVEDIQLMENAARTAPRRYVNGLERCITKDAPISLAEKKNWKAAKEKGLKLFEPKYGGSYDIFNERPINTDIEYYCVIDVQFLPLLRNLYWGRLSDGWKTKVMDETKKRVLGSQSPAYQPHSEEKKFGPWGGSPHKFLSGANEDEVSRISFHMVGSLFWYPKIY